MEPTSIASLLKLLAALGVSVALAGTASTTLPQASASAASSSAAATPAPVVVPQATQSSSSINWAGYVANQGSYTAVSGTWIVPTITNVESDQADATWVGIGGVDSRDLIQAGTEAIPNSAGGIEYHAWYELLPGDSHIVPLSVSPGDSVGVMITKVGTDTWNINFSDTTTGTSYSARVNYHSSLSSAEWIEEMPVGVDAPVSLDSFGSVRFLAGFATKNGQGVTIAGSGAHALNMQNSDNQVLATASALGTDGSTFSVMRTDASADPLALTRFGSVRPIVSAPNVPQQAQTAAAVSAGEPQQIVVPMHTMRRGGRGRLIIRVF